MRAMQVRRGTDADAPAAAAVARRVLAEHGLPFDPGGADAGLLRPEASYRATGGDFFVAVDGSGRVVGTVALAVTGPGRGELGKLFLLPEARGAGLGRALVAAVLDAAVAAGLERVGLLTRDRYDRAIRVYERAGFRPDGTARHRRDGDVGRAYAIDLVPSMAAARAG